jgi:hypothetical protein
MRFFYQYLGKMSCVTIAVASWLSYSQTPMIDRRRFLQMSITGLGAVAASKLLAASTTMPLGVQLYTVWDQAERDLPAVFEAIRKIGYREVELYWNIYTHPAKKLRRVLDDHGLRAPSGHFEAAQVHVEQP